MVYNNQIIDKIMEKDSHAQTIKLILKMAWPIILANVLQAAYQLTDSFWVGRLGKQAVAAVTISGPIIFLTMALGIGFATAGSILVAQYFGAKNEKMINKSAGQTLLMVIGVSILFSIIGWVLAPYILKAMGTSDDFFTLALSFLRISFIALIFNFSFFMFQSIMRSIGRAKVPIYIIVGTVLLNFILDPVLMLGLGPIPALGVKGVALSTLSTQILAALIGFSILFSGKRGIKLHKKDFYPDLKFIKRSFLLGLPSSIDQSARSLGMVVMTALITSFGTVAVASYGAGSNIVQVSVIIGLGLAAASSILVGHNIGAGNIEEAEKTAKYSGHIAFVFLTTFGLLVYFLAPYLVSFFIPGETQAIAIGSTYLRISSLFFGFMGLQMIFSGVFQASGNTMISMSLTIFSQWVIQLPLAYLLSRHTSLGLNGIWLSFPISNLAVATISWLAFKNGYWKKKRLIKEEEKIELMVSQKVMAEESVPYDY